MKRIEAQKRDGQQKRIPRHHSNSDRKRKKKCVDVFGIQMIADQFGDGWHKCIVDLFGHSGLKPFLVMGGISNSNII